MKRKDKEELVPHNVMIIKMTLAQERWHKKAFRFLEQNPVCSACGDELHHFSYTMLCDACRNRKNYKRFVSLHPLYNKQNKVRQAVRSRRHYLAHKDEINHRRSIRRREKRRRSHEDSLRFELGRLERAVRAAGYCRGGGKNVVSEMR